MTTTRPSQTIRWRSFQRWFERGNFEIVRASYQNLLMNLVRLRTVFVPVFIVACLSVFSADPVSGAELLSGD